ncbi:UNVERIFIED_CONTAM: hypothetical protein DES50_102307 [Williamsia faeni]
MAVNREPSIRRTAHPAGAVPERPVAVTPAPTLTDRIGVEVAEAVTPTVPVGEKRSETHNSRIRPSTKDRLRRAVDKLRYDTGDRSISEASLTDAAIDEYLKKREM